MTHAAQNVLQPSGCMRVHVSTPWRPRCWNFRRERENTSSLPS
jgi:hypothetical protein